MFKRIKALFVAIIRIVIRKGEKKFSIARLESEIETCSNKMSKMKDQMVDQKTELQITTSKVDAITDVIKIMKGQLKEAVAQNKEDLAKKIFNRIQQETETKEIYAKSKDELTLAIDKLTKVYNVIEKRVDKLKHEVRCAKMRKEMADLTQGTVECIQDIQGDGLISGVDNILEDIKRDEIKADIKFDELTDTVDIDTQLQGEVSMDTIKSFLED